LLNSPFINNINIISNSLGEIMSKDRPDYYDADLAIRLYDLRREAVMRESRNAINGKFWPKNYEDVLAISNPEHPLNAPFRQTSTYWEMVYGMVKHGIVNGDYLLESNGEGLFLFAKIHPYLEQLRKDLSPLAFQNAEWVTTNVPIGKQFFEMILARVKKMTETK
jgi:hypothetical protein